jgi:transposase InsO family protein
VGISRGVILDFSRPGKPTDNSFIESFNGKFRNECLNTHWFLSLDDARQKMEEVRPHSAISNKAPVTRAIVTRWPVSPQLVALLSRLIANLDRVGSAETSAQKS